MDNRSISQIKDLIAGNDSIAIAVSQNPSVDAMGAALALSLALQTTGKKVSVASPTEPLVAVSSLVGIDNVKTALDGNGKDLVVSFPYKEGEIEKVSYTLENGFLNIIVKAGELGLSFGENDVQYRRGGAPAGLLFVIGASRLSDLGPIFDPEALKDTTVVNIDNKNDNQGFGDVAIVSTQYSSLSEGVAKLIAELDLPLDVDSAQNLLSGISDATNNFQSPTTSYVAFEMAAMLMRNGAIRETVASQPRLTQQQQTQFFGTPRDTQNRDNRRDTAQTQPRDMLQRFPSNQPRQQQDFRDRSQNQPKGFPKPQQSHGQQPNQPQSHQQNQPQSHQQRQQEIRNQLQSMQQQSQPLPQSHGQQQANQPQQHREQQNEHRPQPEAKQEEKKRIEEPPQDWLTPKVYKGSTNI